MVTRKHRVLVVDDDPEVCLALEVLLQDAGMTVSVLHHPDAIPDTLAETAFDLILLDVNFSPGRPDQQEGLRWLQYLHEHLPDTPVIIMTAYGDVEMAVKALKTGAIDFVQKPWRNEKLMATVHAALQFRNSQLEVRRLRDRQKHLTQDLRHPFTAIVGQSEAIQEIFRTIEKVARTDANVLILGETGTGKELVARAIHQASPRRDEVFVSVDMGALTGTLFESELFGYIRGAFTDAREDRPGRFEIASGGTLFLDEIGNLPFPLQAKLLTVIEKREVTRLGSSQPIPVDIRLICASNRSLYDMVREGSFRQDLLYRINTVEIHIPPLRDRTEDIPLLLDHFIQYYSRKYGREPLAVPSELMNRLQGYSWPGNVRELQNLVERAVIMNDAGLLDPERRRAPRIGDDFEGPLLVNTLHLPTVERTVIEQAIRKHDGNLTRAAQELGISRQALYRRMVKYGLV